MITTARDGEDTLFSAKDLATALQIRNVSKMAEHLPVTEMRRRQVPTRGGVQKCLYLTTRGVRRVLSRSRSPYAADIAREIGMDVVDSHFACVEATTISLVMDAFRGFDMVRQYKCMHYWVDLYFPLQRVAVECDENGHVYRASQDAARQADITLALQCTFVRFSPQQPTFQFPLLVNDLMRALRLVPGLD